MRALTGLVATTSITLALAAGTGCQSPPRRAASTASAATPPHRQSAAPARTVSPAAGADGAQAPQVVVSPAPPAVKAAPEYDLAKDIAARTAKAREELGQGTEVKTVANIYVVIGAPGWTGQAFANSVSLIESALTAYMNNRFKTAPTKAISVYLFGAAPSYGAYCKKAFDEPCISVYGFYRHDVRAMIMNAGLGLGTLTHEMVHPLVESDFPDAPTWINEGIASLFEQPLLTGRGEIHGGKNWRHPRLLQGLNTATEKAEIRLDSIFTMSDGSFRDRNESLHYAAARYVCQWLDAQNKLWPFYQAWRDDFAHDATGEKAFAKTMGKSPAELHGAWERWVRAL